MSHLCLNGLGHGGQPIPVAVTLAGLLATGGVDRETGKRPADLADEVANVFSNIRRFSPLAAPARITC